MSKNYDFCGYVTRNDLECSDGRIIKKNAFSHQDGERVPLAWNHNHDTPEAVLGYTILENRPDGVYGYSYLNDTKAAQDVKELVRHGDIDSYSIYANHLKQVANQVLHGSIKEVSLVFSGANPGAYIEDVALAHSADGSEIATEAIMYVGDSDMEYNDYLEHSDANDSVADVLDTLTEEQKDAVALLLGAVQMANDSYEEDEDLEHSDFEDEDEDDSDEEYYDEEYDDEDGVDEEYADGYNEYSDDEYYDDDDIDDEYDEEYDDYDEGDSDMKTNVFDSEVSYGENVLTHSDFLAIKDLAKEKGSFKDAYREYVEENNFLQHDDSSSIIPATGTQTYGFNDPDMLFPDYKALSVTPEWIKRDTSWVSEFWGKVHRVPFSRIKSLYADITEYEARAKGYIQKGSLKREEVFKTMKRVTEPTTIYKKQKLDKQDIDDITDFDVVAWIRAEMRVMLNEEIARAALIGDGRSAADQDKIDETKIRPIYLDEDFYTIRVDVDTSNVKNIIRASVKSRKDYKGSGNTTFFTTEDVLTDLLLLEDNMGHRLYKTETELCAAMRVSRIVTVEVMEGLRHPTTNKGCIGIIVNPADYTVGANKGGNIDMFDDFDIDYNQYKYLLETRCCGALTKYHSAIVLEGPVENP